MNAGLAHFPDRPFGHCAITASAGSGKTFRLAHRYIALLAGDVPPERICALTFSRKAAGEIFDEIVRYLCAAASDAATAAQTAKHAGVEIDAQGFVKMLARFLRNLHKLRIGTLDGFLVAVIRAFPLELGAPVDLRLMEEGGGEEHSQRLRLLRFIFDPERIEKEKRQAFLDAFKQATFGQDEKQMVDRLERFVREYLGQYRDMPSPAAWNAADQIWPDGMPYGMLSESEVDAAMARLEDIAATGIPGLAETVESALRASVHSRWPHEFAGKRAFSIMTELLENEVPTPEVSYGKKKHTLSVECARVIRAGASHLFAVELKKNMIRTLGLHAVLSMYEAVYEERVRGRGLLSFDDLSAFIAAPAAPPLSRMKGRRDRLFIDFRLDSALDHWLLDEFQDTSDSQWAVLSNLIDEIIQDGSGTRSFFYVGDVKQSIYGWRGGNYRLFGEILERYGSVIDLETLAESHRSAPAIIETLNRVFGKLDETGDLPDSAVADWNRYWEVHQSAERLRDVDGLAALLEIPPVEGRKAYEVQIERIAEILNAELYVERGFEVAVLVRTNDEGRRCVDILRSTSPTLDIVHEGASAILDAPSVTLLMDLLRAAAHPADRFAWAHALMSPLHKWFETESEREAFVYSTLRLVQDEGIAAVLDIWIERLDEAGGLDRFGRLRLEQLKQAAFTFDQGGERNVDDFGRYIKGLGIRAAADERAVRVMTVHQAKGLGFDVVFVPFGERGHNLVNVRNVRFVGGKEKGWLLNRPPKEICEFDPALRKDVECRRAEQCFSELCVLYVAMSRAKRALYMLVDTPAKKASAIYDSTLLRNALSRISADKESVSSRPDECVYSAGNFAWHEKTPRKTKPSVPEVKPISRLLPPAAGGEPVRREPSDQDIREGQAGLYFNREAGDVLRFGSAIHQLFERVTWTSAVEIDKIVSEWKGQCREDAALVEDVERQFRRCLQSGEVRDALQRPPGEVLLWRERPFDVIRDGTLISGRFDRVVLKISGSGETTEAEILDFKSNRVADDPRRLAAVSAHYRDQMADYKTALAVLTGLDSRRIHCSLLFTRIGRVVRIDEFPARDGSDA